MTAALVQRGGGCPRAPKTRDWWQQAVEARAIVPGVLGAAVAVGFSAFTVYVPLRAVEVGEVNPGLGLSVYAVATIVVLPFVGRTYDRLGRSAVILPGLLSCVTGLAILAFATSTPLMLAACVLVGVGVGSTVPALTAWTANRVVQARRAVASGTFWTIYEIGLFGGSALMGLLFAIVRYSGFVVLAGVIAVIAIGYGLGWRAPRAQELAEGRPG